MPKISFASVENAPVVASPEGSVGEVETRAILVRERDPIHLHQHRLAPGASVSFTGTPTDRAVYVWQGAIDACGTQLGARSSLIVEYDAVVSASASGEGATLLEFNMKDRCAEDRAGGNVHLLPSTRAPHIAGVHGGGRIDMALHADSQCPTCKVWLHESDWSGADVETVLHSHSEDEIIFVVGGNMRVGKRHYGPGTALAVAANTKYGFFSGPDGLSFINFRGTSPIYTLADGSIVLDEEELWRKNGGGKPDYLTPQPT